MRIEDKDLLSPEFYARNGYPHSAWAKLRQDDPVHYVADWAGDPYWAITRHAEISEISKNPGRFSSAHRFVLYPFKGAPIQPFRTLLDMDPPAHWEYRGLVSRKFAPAALGSLRGRALNLFDDILESATSRAANGAFDFVEQISARLPIWMIAEMIGADREDWNRLYNWTNAMVGAADPEYNRGRSEEETRLQAWSEMAQYFANLCEERRNMPRDDLATDLANARIGGEPIPQMELLSYFTTLFAAGNETTRNATTGGLLLLIENPDLLERMRRGDASYDGFVEEVVRMVSPVVHMARTATQDVELCGSRIRAGDLVVMFFPSANRDSEVFEDPDVFRSDRRPNLHLGFGTGEHFCLGKHLARLELRATFQRLIERIESVELAGPPDRLASAIVGGIKRLPVRLQLKAKK